MLMGLKMNKNAQVDPIKLIVAFIVIGVVATIVLFGFNRMFAKEVNNVDSNIDSLKDSDGDGKPDFLNTWQDSTDDEVVDEEDDGGR